MIGRISRTRDGAASIRTYQESQPENTIRRG